MSSTPPVPSLSELLDSARVVSLPLTNRFRSIDVREVMLLRGPQGWTEFSPFPEYDDEEASSWLAAAIEFGWHETEAATDRVRVNATLPAVPVEAVAAVLARFTGCRTVKVKVAEPGQTLADDVARVAEARRVLGAEGRIRVDANGGWNVDEAEHAIHALAPFDLEYVEQPCATVPELAEIRERVKYMGIPIAADESVRRAADPLAVVDAGAADILVIKAQPLGGIRSAIALIERAGLPVVVSSALESSVGLSMGAHLAARVQDLEFDCGLGTAALLAADVTDEPLLPVDGFIPVRRIDVSAGLVTAHAAPADRDSWWHARLTRCYALLD